MSKSGELSVPLATGLSGGLTEDWLSLGLGLLVFALALSGLAGVDLLGWAVSTSVWTDLGKALGTTSKSYTALGGIGALVATYLALLVSLTLGAWALKADPRRFALAFTAVFWIAYASWILGSFANVSRLRICRNSASAGPCGLQTRAAISLPCWSA